MMLEILRLGLEQQPLLVERVLGTHVYLCLANLSVLVDSRSCHLESCPWLLLIPPAECPKVPVWLPLVSQSLWISWGRGYMTQSCKEVSSNV